MAVAPTILQKCLIDDDDHAWVSLWHFLERNVARHLRRILKSHGFSEMDAENVSMELWAHLFANDGQRLASFRGRTRAELKAWLVRVGVNYTLNWVHQRLRGIRREQSAAAAKSLPDRSGPTEQDVESFFQELEPLADKGDVYKLRVLAGQASKDVSERALRKWSSNLRHKYRKHF